jgi:DNA-entry nuclease
MKNKIKLLLLVSPLLFGSIASNLTTTVSAKTVIKYTHPHQKDTKKLESENKDLEEKIKAAEQKNSKLTKEANDNKKKLHHSAVKTNTKSNDLTKLTYTGKQEVIVNGNKPNFSKNDLSIKNGAWDKYGDLDQLNRATPANALLNISLMPTAKREALHVDPTGWHNKRISSGWLYNRSHLIGYQLTGQNNNLKNLITGTRSLNAPEMLAHEMDIAYYLKQDQNHYIRYRVTPIFKGNELLARGVQMEAQSIGDNTVQFNVFIFNVEDGVKLNYQDGTSVVE